MNSLDLDQYAPFSDWFKFEKKILKEVPPKKGAYVLRTYLGKKFGRLKSESDILYVGKSESVKGLKQRLRFYFKPGKTQWTSIRINKMMQKYKMEIAWCVSNEATNLETKLLRSYIDDHDELPPFNRAGSKRWIHSISDAIGLTASIQVIKSKVLKL